MKEKDLIFNFYDRLEPRFRPQVLLKYSFNVKVKGNSLLPHLTPKNLKQRIPALLQFIDEFCSRYPGASMSTERPIFPCAFSVKVWNEYAERGGFRSRCQQEFTVYQDGIAFCPPSRDIEERTPITSADGLRKRIALLRERFSVVCRRPSFTKCRSCGNRTDDSCQGGCGGYKA
jgi:hypothetical protein